MKAKGTPQSGRSVHFGRPSGRIFFLGAVYEYQLRCAPPPRTRPPIGWGTSDGPDQLDTSDETFTKEVLVEYYWSICSVLSQLKYQIAYFIITYNAYSQ